MVEEIALILYMVLVFIIIVGVIVILVSKGRDDTDPPKGSSGLRLYIDHRTGLHYLSGSNGGITARLDRDGRQIYDKENVK